MIQSDDPRDAELARLRAALATVTDERDRFDSALTQAAECDRLTHEELQALDRQVATMTAERDRLRAYAGWEIVALLKELGEVEAQRDAAQADRETERGWRYDLRVQLELALNDNVALRRVLNQIAGGPADPATYRYRTLARNALAIPGPGAAYAAKVQALVEATTAILDRGPTVAVLDEIDPVGFTMRLNSMAVSSQAIRQAHAALAALGEGTR